MLELDAMSQPIVKDRYEGEVPPGKVANGRPRIVQSVRFGGEPLLVDAVAEGSRRERVCRVDDCVLTTGEAAEIPCVRALDVVSDQDDRLAFEPGQRSLLEPV